MSIRPTNKIVILDSLLLLAFFGCSGKNTKDMTKQKEMETTVVNLTKDTHDEYIGRGSEPRTHMLTEGIKLHAEGWLGNPHPIGWCDICSERHTRTECISKFKQDFYKKINSDSDFKGHVLLLKGKRLGCYCKPKECHGDVIKEYIDSNDFKQK